MEKLVWTALEYEEKERSSDWFWALGVIVVTGSIASIIYDNYFFATLIILSGALLGYFAKKAPDLVTFELNQGGLKIHSHLYPYENIKSFFVQVDTDGRMNLPPTLFVKTERIFMPILSIPLEIDIVESVHNIFTEKNVPEEEMKAHPYEKIMETLGF